VRYISQVKRKILDALYRQTHLSLRPANYEVDIGKDFFSFLVKKPRVEAAHTLALYGVK
jgi:hypothetical protein